MIGCYPRDNVQEAPRRDTSLQAREEGSMEATNVEAMITRVRPSLENVEGKEEILSFLERFTGERDAMLKRQAHLNSLARLAEKMVSDAHSQAERIKSEAYETAQANAKGIMLQAEEQAQRIIEEAKRKAESPTGNEMFAIKNGAEEELKALVNEHAIRLRHQAKELGTCIYQQMLIEAEGTRRRLELFQADLEKRLSSLGTPAVQAAMQDDTTNTAEAAATPAGDSAADITKGPAAPANACRAEETAADQPVCRTNDDALPAADALAVSDRGREDQCRQAQPALAEPLTTTDEPGAQKDYEIRTDLVHLEISPPQDEETMEAIRACLDRLDEVATAHTTCLAGKAVLQVVLLQPLDLVAALSGLLEVQQVQKVTSGDLTKIQIALAAPAKTMVGVR